MSTVISQGRFSRQNSNSLVNDIFLNVKGLPVRAARKEVDNSFVSVR